ncbi:MAG: zeta toxin family protein, partial [Propionibacteriaceae bacterium]|nr:zeta toxin family protein [Propionibacteriaceae bacterium]
MTARPKLSETDLETIWADEIEPWLFAGAVAAGRPVALLVGAQPGAGKSHGIGRAEALHPGIAFTRVIGDDLRPFHPGYPDAFESPDPELMPAATADAAGWWVRRALAHAAAQRVSIAVEGTFRDPAVPLRTAQRLAETG